MTIYLFVIEEEQRFTLSQIHRFANEYLCFWSPKLGSYSAFSNRLNRLSKAFKDSVTDLISKYFPDGCLHNQSLLDSMPIVTCSGKRSGNQAKDITDEGYCSVKRMFYYGAKLNVLAFRGENKISFPEEIQITPASVNNLTVFKQVRSMKDDKCFFGGKIIYKNKEFFSDIEKEKSSLMLIPVKAVKGEFQEIRNRDKASNELYSTDFLRVRQPVESFFNWLIIQRTSRVISAKALYISCFNFLSQLEFLCLNYHSNSL